MPSSAAERPAKFEEGRTYRSPGGRLWKVVEEPEPGYVILTEVLDHPLPFSITLRADATAGWEET